ncbi:ESPR-type extended signal peptide-containing protein, partial [Pasteurella skyensis]
MNSIYKIVFNKATQTFTAVSELAKGATKTQSQSAKQAGTFLPKFAKIALAISMVLGFSTSAMAVTDAEFNALKQQVEALQARKTYIHANGTGQVQTGNDTNLDTVDGVGGAKGVSSVAIGKGAVAIGESSVALGVDSRALSYASTALGGATIARGMESLATNWRTDAIGNFSTAMGVDSKAVGEGSLATGGMTDKRMLELLGSDDSTADYETIATEYKDAFTAEEITLITSTDVSRSKKYSFIVGRVGEFKGTLGGKAYSNGSIALGVGTIAGKLARFDDRGTGITTDDIYEAGTEEAVAMGYRAKAIKDKTLALGFDAKAEHTNSVALGSNAETRDFTQVDETDVINGLKYKEFSGFADGVVSVGKTAHEKQIINVAPGKISQESTDAINGSQLFATNTVLGNVATSVKDNLGGNAAIDENGNITFTDIGGTGKDTVQEAIAFNKGNIETNTANINGNRTAIATKADKDADNLSV